MSADYIAGCHDGHVLDFFYPLRLCACLKFLYGFMYFHTSVVTKRAETHEESANYSYVYIYIYIHTPIHVFLCICCTQRCFT